MFPFCRPLILALAAAWLSWGPSWIGRPAAGDDGRAMSSSSASFQATIRPILAGHCFACHGPDASQRQADVRLDTPEGVAAVLGSGPDGSPNRLLDRIFSGDPRRMMPPPDHHKPLSDSQRSAIREWIRAGAEVATHWAFVPPRRHELPGSGRPGGTASDRVDRWIDHRLRRVGFQPNGPADRARLARRVALDLTGLPPTWDRVRRFIHDRSPDAYGRFVDELLHSPAFGEHWAKYWLDLVRYGDTHGMNRDNHREMWAYRDWVVDALNSNMPMDAFIRRQLAGDLLPDRTRADRIASGFNRLHVSTNEAGSIPQEMFARNVIDRTESFGTIFLGMTVGCAACHDHKYDPLSQADFYSLSAFFNSLDGDPLNGDRKDHPPSIPLPSPEQAEQLREIDAELSKIRSEMAGPLAGVDRAQSQWLAALDESVSAAAESAPVVLGDLHLLGPMEPTDRYGVLSSVRSQESPDLTKPHLLGGRRLHWQHRSDLLPGLAHRLPAWGDRPSVVLIHQVVHARQRVTVTLSLGTDDRHTVYLDDQRIGGQSKTGPRRPLGRSYELKLEEGLHHLWIEHFNSAGAAEWTVGWPSSVVASPSHLEPLWNQMRLADPTRHAAAVRSYYRHCVCEHPDWQVLVDYHDGLKSLRKALLAEVPTTLVWRELPEPRPAHVLVRGRYDMPGRPVARRTPAFLPGLDRPSELTRLDLADWLVSPQHPLTARVAVNRFWQQLFGTGLVETPGDFGRQGAAPSHPELLDELAIDFRESGWDVKTLLRRLVMTRAYRRSAAQTPAMRRLDPRNRLLARGPRFRLDAETLRDQALAVSGLLVRQLGGPSVKPPQPEGLWKAVGFSDSNTGVFVPSSGSDTLRRSLYTFWKRSSPPAALATLDAPTRESCTVRRERTNTPLQALYMLNDDQMVRAARELAHASAREIVPEAAPAVAEGRSSADQLSAKPAAPPERTETGTSPESLSAIDSRRLAALFHRVLLRPMTDLEQRTLADLLVQVRTAYRQDPQAAETLSGRPDPEAAAWIIIASTLLNHDEVWCK